MTMGSELDHDLETGLRRVVEAATAIALQQAQLHDRSRRTDLAVDRDRIARDLHDTVVQHLFATGLTLQTALQLGDGTAEVTDRIEHAIGELDHVIREIRSTVFELHLAIAADGGVRRKLLELGDELSSALGFQPSFEFQGPVDELIPDQAAAHLLAAVGEALANVARHARSPSASVLVTVDGHSLCTLVDDEGIGPGDLRIGGHGLTNLAHRAGELGGTCTLEKRPGGGSRLRWQITV